MQRFITLAFLLLCAVGSAVGTQNLPDRIILNLTGEPAYSMAVTWRTPSPLTDAKVQFAAATGWTEFEKKTQSRLAQSTVFITDEKQTVYHYSAVMDSLSPNTSYVYRVGCEDAWSAWYQFRTAYATSAPFEFVFLGDPQNGLREHCSRMFTQAFKTAPQAAFWLFSGDLVSEPEDWQYRDFFRAGKLIWKNIPSLMTPGNHDRAFQYEDGVIKQNAKGDKIRLDRVADEWKNHFTLPENGPADLKETSYHVDYQNVRFILVDTNDEDQYANQAVWIRSLLIDNPNRWTIISFHRPFYSAGRNRDDRKTRDAFGALFDEFHVDLVLTGHDHAYARSHKLFNNDKVAWNEKGTVYVVSVSGPKMYTVNSNYNHLMAKTGGYVQLFQIISIEDSKLTYKCHTVTGELYDEFVITK